jgi:hypothetical protein
MARLLLLIAIIVVIALLVRKLVKGRRATTPDTPDPQAKLVQCVECGAFVPRADALPVPNGFRCGGAGCNVNR